MLARNSTLVICLALLGVTTLAAGGVGAMDADRGGASALGAAPSAVAGSQHDNTTVSIERSIVTVRGGDTATIELTLDGTDEATIVVGGDGAADNVTATATDGNGDGVVQLEFETGPIGTMRTRFVPVDDGDDYEMSNFSEFGGPLPAGEYPIRVYVGHGVSGEPTDVGTLVVNERTPEPTTEPPEQTTETTTPLPEASFDYEGNAVTLRPDAGQTIEGTTSRRPDRSVTVRLRSSGGSPFLKSEQVLVGEEGKFSATFDLGDVEAPANATTVVLVDGERVAGPVDVEIVGAQMETTAQETSSPGQDGFGARMAVAAILAALPLLKRSR